MVNEAVLATLAEEADILKYTDQRQAEPSSGFEEYVISLGNSSQL